MIHSNLLKQMEKLNQVKAKSQPEMAKNPKLAKVLKSADQEISSREKPKKLDTADKASPKSHLKSDYVAFVPEYVHKEIPEGVAELHGGVSDQLRLVGISDISGDNNPDFCFWNPQTKELAINTIGVAGNRTRALTSLAIPSGDWEPQGFVNMSQLGSPNYADIVWRQKSGAGQVLIWRSSANNINGFEFNTSYTLAIAIPDQSWQIQACADLNGDGLGDLVWRNTVTGQVVVWILNESNIVNQYFLPTVPPSWRIVGVTDFNGDGNPDIFWRNTAGAGETVIWYMNAGFTAKIGEAYSNAISDLSWSATAVGRVGGNPVVAWKGNAAFTPRFGNLLWTMSGSTIVSTSLVPSNIVSSNLTFISPDFHQSCGFGVANLTRSLAFLTGQSLLPETTDLFYPATGEELVKAQEGNSGGFIGAGITIAVVDDGVDFSIPTLARIKWVNPNTAENRPNGYDFVNNSPVVYAPGQNHGTACAEIIASAAPGVKIMAIKTGIGSGQLSVAAISAGIIWAVDKGVRIFSCSYGGGTDPDGIAAVNYGISKGAIFIASAGNSPIVLDSFPASLSTSDNVIAVTAIERDGRFVTAFSRAGSNPRNIVAAPTNIPLTYYPNGFYGTSAACPYVSALVAILKAAKPTATVVEIKNSIIVGATVDNFWIA